MNAEIMKKSLAVFLSFALLASAQQIGQNAAGQAPVATFSTTSQLVVETVSVKDKSGKPIEGLTAKDFTITEDGVAQMISFSEYQKLPDTPADAETLEPSKAEPVIVNHLARTDIKPEKPGEISHRDRRLLALYFDMSAMPVPDQIRALSAAEKFIRSQMQKADLMCIMRYSGSSVDVLVDFTDDRDKLLTAVETMIVGEGQGFDETDTSTAADTGAAFGQDDSEFNLFTTDRQLSALQTAAKMLGSLNEKKSLIYFASGLKLNGVDNQAQLHATENAAIKAGVSFWPVDARGLMALPPTGVGGGQGGQAMYSGASAMAMVTSMQRTQDTLWAIAADTGGKALLDNNDLSMGIVQAQKATQSYYILGYYATNTNLDGKFRKVKITLNADTTAKLEQGRQGYYAGKVWAKLGTADKERQLEDAMMLGDPITDLTVAMEIDYFQLNKAEYFVPMIVKIPGSELALAKRGGALQTQIDFILEVKDDYGSTIQNIKEKAGPIKLSEATAAELNKRPVEYDTGFTLLPGKYKVKFLARDLETGRMGTFETPFVIPNLNNENKRLPISSVVVSSQKVDLKDALFNANKDKDKLETKNPLVLEGQKLIPSVTRVFSKSKDMYIYLQAYEQGATSTRPVVGFVSFYKGQDKVFETAPIQIAETLPQTLKTLPVRFTVPLDKLATGEYNCQVTLLDPTGQKAAFWSAPVMVVQ
ncbi:MAG TPA: VWA domain-containing protein [Bryobacteraceae bacterium]|jgi:VWFA-related protein